MLPASNIVSLTIVRDPPYPADIRARGWRFELDLDRVFQSDTWALAPPELRPWLLMIWVTAWAQSPCGSLPADDRLVIARIGMERGMFDEHREVLLRGWWPASDGRMYHDVLIERVLSMVNLKRRESDRKAAYRIKMSHGTDAGQTRDSGGTPPGRDDTGTGTRTSSQEAISDEIARARPADEPTELTLVEKSLPCPHLEILALWSEVLPALPRHNPEQWRGTRADHLRARWRETAARRTWETKQQGIDWFRRLFAYVGQSHFLTGNAPTSPGKRPFVAELEWLVRPGSWAKTIEGKYHSEKPQ